MVKRLPTMRETLVRSLGQEDLLEKEMVTHSSILAWKIPWTEELGWLLSWGRKESDMTERLHYHYNSPVKPSGSKLLIVGRILITESILLLVIGILRFSIS